MDEMVVVASYSHRDNKLFHHAIEVMHRAEPDTYHSRVSYRWTIITFITHQIAINNWHVNGLVTGSASSLQSITTTICRCTLSAISWAQTTHARKSACGMSASERTAGAGLKSATTTRRRSSLLPSCSIHFRLYHYPRRQHIDIIIILFLHHHLLHLYQEQKLVRILFFRKWTKVIP